MTVDLHRVCVSQLRRNRRNRPRTPRKPEESEAVRSLPRTCVARPYRAGHSIFDPKFAARLTRHGVEQVLADITSIMDRSVVDKGEDE